MAEGLIVVEIQNAFRTLNSGRADYSNHRITPKVKEKRNRNTTNIICSHDIQAKILSS